MFRRLDVLPRWHHTERTCIKLKSEAPIVALPPTLRSVGGTGYTAHARANTSVVGCQLEAGGGDFMHPEVWSPCSSGDGIEFTSWEHAPQFLVDLGNIKLRQMMEPRPAGR